MIFCDRAISQNYIQTSQIANGGSSIYFPFRVNYEDARSEISYQNISFLADTIFSIGFEIQDRGSFYDEHFCCNGEAKNNTYHQFFLVKAIDDFDTEHMYLNAYY